MAEAYRPDPLSPTGVKFVQVFSVCVLNVSVDMCNAYKFTSESQQKFMVTSGKLKLIYELTLVAEVWCSDWCTVRPTLYLTLGLVL